ncbi:MAG: hypothetical protein H7066_16220 [Cytophagaceae bacterium]|nr:hypothetical protein [Gemmatimonadaceae bacterium]
MVLPRRSVVPFLAVLGVLAACGSSVDVGTDFAGSPTGVTGGANVITISLRKTTFGWEESSFNGNGIQATISNPSGRAYYARIGDAFNAATEQSPVFIALGTDAAIERQGNDGTWSVMPTGILVEGSKVVTIKAGGSYELRGNLSEPRQVGTMRIRLRYFTTTDATGTAMTDYSPAFIVH